VVTGGKLTDPTRDMSFDRTGDDLVDGLFVGLDAWQGHLLRLDRSPAPRPIARRR
jgi:hypothetical protein